MDVKKGKDSHLKNIFSPLYPFSLALFIAVRFQIHNYFCSCRVVSKPWSGQTCSNVESCFAGAYIMVWFVIKEKWSHQVKTISKTLQNCFENVKVMLLFCTQLSNLWWMPNSVSKGISMRTGSSRQFQCNHTQLCVSFISILGTRIKYDTP